MKFCTCWGFRLNYRHWTHITNPKSKSKLCIGVDCVCHSAWATEDVTNMLKLGHTCLWLIKMINDVQRFYAVVISDNNWSSMFAITETDPKVQAFQNKWDAWLLVCWQLIWDKKTPQYRWWREAGLIVLLWCNGQSAGLGSRRHWDQLPTQLRSLVWAGPTKGGRW